MCVVPTRRPCRPFLTKPLPFCSPLPAGCNFHAVAPTSWWQAIAKLAKQLGTTPEALLKNQMLVDRLAGKPWGGGCFHGSGGWDL